VGDILALPAFIVGVVAAIAAVAVITVKSPADRRLRRGLFGALAVAVVIAAYLFFPSVTTGQYSDPAEAQSLDDDAADLPMAPDVEHRVDLSLTGDQNFLGVDLDTGQVKAELDDGQDIEVYNGRLHIANEGLIGQPKPTEVASESTADILASCTQGGLSQDTTSEIHVGDIQRSQVLCLVTDQGHTAAILVMTPTLNLREAPMEVLVAVGAG
jgi:hypothetical protein